MMRLIPTGSCLGAILAYAGCKGSQPAPPPAETRARAAPDGYIDAGGGVRLFYRVVGSGPDTVVVVHGGPGFTMDYFLDDLEPLARRHALVFYDQRGAGKSSLVTDSVALDGQRFAEDLEAVRKHFGLERANILGHSWGAGVVALYAARYPERVGQLIIVGALPLQGAQLTKAFQRLAASRDPGTTRQMKQAMDARIADPGDPKACHAYYVLWFTPFFADSAAMGRSKGDFCAGTPESRRNKIASVDRFTMASLGRWDWRASLEPVKARTLVIHGIQDPLPLEGARDWAGTLPNARLLLLQEAGHFPYLESPDRFYPAVEAFLEGRWPDGVETPTLR